MSKLIMEWRSDEMLPKLCFVIKGVIDEMLESEKMRILNST